MSTAILCELKKLLHNAAFCLFGALLLAAGAFYPFVRALAPDANGVALMDRQAVLAAYADVSPQQAAADIEDRLDALEVYGQLQLLRQTALPVLQETARQALAERGFTEKALAQLDPADLLRFSDSAARERVLLQAAQAQVQAVLQYPAYLQQIEQRADALGQTIFARAGNFDAAAARRTAQQYRPLSGLQVPLAAPYGVEVALGDVWSDLLLVLFAFLLAMAIFAQDRPSMASPVVRAARAGLARAFAAKTAVAAVLLALVWAWFLAVQLLCGGLVLGLGDLDRCVQSLPAFYRAPYALSVRALLACAPVCRLLAAWVILLVFSAFCASFSGPLACAACAAAAALCAGARALLPESSALRLLKYCTPAAWLRPELLFGDYLLFSFGPLSFSYAELFGTLVPVSLAGLAVLGRLGCGSLEFHRPAPRKAVGRRRMRRPSLFAFEVRKLLRSQNIAAALLFLLAAQLFACSMFSTAASEEEVRYEARLTALQGPYTEEKYRQVAEELAQLQQLEAELAQNPQGAESFALQLRLQEKPALQRLAALGETLRTRAQSGRPAYYVPAAGYIRALGFEQVGPRYQPALFAVLLALALSGLFAVEHESGLFQLDKTLPRATSGLYWPKVGVCCAVTLALHLAVWLPEEIYLFSHYRFPYLCAPAADLPELAGAPQGMPLWGALLAVRCVRLCGSFCFAALLFALALHSRSRVSALLGGVGAAAGLFSLGAALPPPLASLSLTAVMAGDGMAVLAPPVFAACLFYLSLALALFGLGEYAWLKLLDKPNF